MDTFAELMASERGRITNERATLVHDRDAIDVAIRALDREMDAIAAYERAKNGKASKGTNGTKARRGSRRQEVVSWITANPQGLRRGELLEVMGLKGDKSGEMAVSNALTALIKSNTLYRNHENKYVVAV